MMDQILECCEGVIGITDDEDHDRNLHNFICTACEHGLIFNGEKCEIKKDSVTFFGTVYDANRVEGRCHPQDTLTRQQTTPSTFLRNGYISLTFHPITLYTHCTTTRTAEKVLRVHAELYIPGSLQPDQEIGLQVL